jgi:hypothetical protein
LSQRGEILEELQLTLTPSRVDQRNQGIMLANWRVGQTINALVSDRMPSGGVLLSVGSQTFVTSRDIPAQPGSRIQFEVQQIEPRLVLRLVNTPTSIGAHRAPDIANGAPINIAQSLPSGLNALYKSLDINLQMSNLKSGEMKALLANNFLNPNAINPTAVQTALYMSGIFTEALWLSNRPSLGARSTKTSLMVLRQRIASALESSGLSSDERLALARLINNIDSSVTSITHQQIASLPQESDRAKWLATLPLQLGEQICEIDVEIERRPRQESDDSPEWKFKFSLTLDTLGPITVLVEIHKGRICVDFKVSSLVHASLSESLPVLRNRLIASGLELDQLSSSISESNSDGENARRAGLNISI